MRRFRFVGDPEEYAGDFEHGIVYDYSVLGDHANHIEMNVEFLASEYPNDWQEVFDEPKTLHKDTDLGYFSLEIIKAYITAPSSTQSHDASDNDFVASCINMARELIKQLNEETK